MTLQQIIDKSNNIVFFGGAGVSTESGIPDFRSPDGLYAQKYDYPPETIVSHSFFNEHTEEFYKFYRDKMIFPDIKPNAAHIKLAELEAAGKLSCIITQNIDGLHAEAGNKNVIELHGSIHRNYCQKCKQSYLLSTITDSDGIPRCECGGIIRPDVVLYDEHLKQDDIDNAIKAIANADTLIIGGTSLTVWPAAGMINYFNGKYLVIINKSPTSADKRADLVIKDNIGTILSKIKV